MNKKGELSNKYAPIVAINYNAIFSRRPSLSEYVTKGKLDRTFVEEYKELTYKLYHANFNVYIVAFEEVDADSLWGRYVFFNNIVVYKDMKDLAFDCKNVYAYYIDTRSRNLLLENSYTLEEFKELL